MKYVLSSQLIPTETTVRRCVKKGIQSLLLDVCRELKIDTSAVYGLDNSNDVKFVTDDLSEIILNRLYQRGVR